VSHITNSNPALALRIQNGYVCPKCFDWTKRKQNLQICERCELSVGLHYHTQKPLGTVADSKTRHARSKCHDVFDLIWSSGFMPRDSAYYWLSQQLGIERDRAHIAMFDAQTCIKAIEVSRKYLTEQNV
jgi:hypothetical protein